MRSENAIMPSRREFLSDALGIGLVTTSTWSIRDGEARSMYGQSDRSAANSGRAIKNTSLTWEVFLAPSIPVIAPDVPPSDTAPRELAGGERQESNDDLRHAWPRGSFLWDQYSSRAISRCPFRRAAGSHQDHAAASIARVSRDVLESALSRSDFESACDRGRTDWKRH
jgi:hypothetical protein